MAAHVACNNDHTSDYVLWIKFNQWFHQAKLSLQSSVCFAKGSQKLYDLDMTIMVSLEMDNMTNDRKQTNHNYSTRVINRPNRVTMWNKRIKAMILLMACWTPLKRSPLFLSTSTAPYKAKKYPFGNHGSHN